MTCRVATGQAATVASGLWHRTRERRGFARTFGAGLTITLAAACGAAPGSDGPGGVAPLLVTEVTPSMLLPGSVIELSTEGETQGAALRVRIRGFIEGLPSGALPVAYDVEAFAITPGHVLVPVPADWHRSLGPRRGALHASIELIADPDTSVVTDAVFALEAEVTPVVEAPPPWTARPGDAIELATSGLLLTSSEGETVVEVEGEISTEIGSPRRIEGTLAVAPLDRMHRTAGAFRADPQILGLEPGAVRWTVTPVNRFPGGVERRGASVEMGFRYARPAIVSTSTGVLRFGRFVEITGGGFLREPGEATVLRIAGMLVPDEGPQRALRVEVVTEVMSSRLLRFVVDDIDELGRTIDLRATTGYLFATLTPVVFHGDAAADGEPYETTLRVGGVRQVIHVSFSSDYARALERFGLRALDTAIRNRVLEVIDRDFAGVGVEIRATEPEDYALYSTIDIDGRDRNGFDAFGNDQNPGKDVGNRRLHDHIGGFSAVAQSDGFPGFGGVFVESFLSLSPSAARPSRLASPTFDALFDPFRSDRGGTSVTGTEAARPLWDVGPGANRCPARRRELQIACAVHALGSLIGTTASHEIGHSLGLAQPYGPADVFHRGGDEPNVLMEAGQARPFEERAEIGGSGPARFMEDELAYLRAILPPDREEP